MDEDQEKTEEPSQYRIEEFKNKGIVASSKELASVLILSISLIIFFYSSFYLYEVFKEYFEWIISVKVNSVYTDKGIKLLLQRSVEAILKSIAPVFSGSMMIAIVSHVMQTGFIFTLEPLTAKLERINPIMGLKKIVSLKSLGEVIKSTIKLSVITVISYLILKSHMLSLRSVLLMDILDSVYLGKEIIVSLLFGLIPVMLFFSFLDFGVEKLLFRKKLLQTKHQQKQETKEREGNPEIKQRIRQIQREAALKRMMKEVPKANVIISNPTHFSVAVRYDSQMLAPTVVAKGVDHMALKIREVAKKNNVPIIENKLLARALYKTVKIGHVIPRSLYKAVAEILAFVYKINKQKSSTFFNKVM